MRCVLGISKFVKGLGILVAIQLGISGSAFSATETYQAESANVSGAKVAGGYVDYINDSGDFIEWSVNAMAGVHKLEFVYALTSGDRPLEIKVNGALVAAKLSFPSTGSWSVYKPAAVSANLITGINKVRATSIGYSGANMDKMLVTFTKAVDPIPPTAVNWTMICQPDTQVLSAYNPEGFKHQTAWIANNALGRNIRHIFHLGDMIDNPARDRQWTNAVAAMNNLNPIRPFVAMSLTIGNHDFDAIYDNNSTVEKWASRFGHAYRAAYPWYGGTSNTYVKEDRNHYCKFTAGGRTFLSIDLQFGPRNIDIDWAIRILAQNPRVPTILGTHGFMKDKYGVYDGGARGSIVFERIVKTHPQIFLVVNGHSSVAGVGTTLKVVANGSTNPDLQPVIQLCCDFQSEPRAVSWFKILTFDIAKNNIRFQTYDPTANVFVLPMVNGVATRQDQAIPVNFARRFAL